jgi:uncharacterized protein
VQEDQNYGRSPEPGEATGGPVGDDPSGGATSPQDERRWSILAHLSILAWPVAGFLPVAPLILWLVYRDRSPRVEFHALQSLWYQVAWLAIFIFAGLLGVILTLVTFGLALLVLVPLAFLVPLFGLIPFVHQIYAAYRVSQGEDYRYPIVADRIDGGVRRTL